MNTQLQHKSLSLPYVIATIVDLVLLGAGAVFVWYAHHRIDQRVENLKETLKAQKAAGQLPAQWQNVDLDHLEKSQLDMRVSEREMLMLDIADFLVGNWIILAPGVLLIGFGIAFWWLRTKAS